jgi:hypothetical protein
MLVGGQRERGNKGWMARKGTREEERERKNECLGMLVEGERE